MEGQKLSLVTLPTSPTPGPRQGNGIVTRDESCVSTLSRLLAVARNLVNVKTARVYHPAFVKILRMQKLYYAFPQKFCFNFSFS